MIKSYINCITINYYTVSDCSSMNKFIEKENYIFSKKIDFK